MTRTARPMRAEITRWFEDFHVGETISLGERTVGRDEIVAFAAQWDPQPMHLEEAAGDASLLHGLAASGWHTATLLMRLFCDSLLSTCASLGSPGIETLKWRRPVHAGDRLVARLEVLSARTSASRPRLGFLQGRFTVENQRGEVVMVMDSTLMIERRAEA